MTRSCVQIDLARQYLELAKLHYPGKAALRHHLFKFLESWAPSDIEIRTAMLVCNMDPDDYMKCVDMVEERYPVRSDTPLVVRGYTPRPTVGCLSFGPIEKNVMIFVTSACARRTGAASQAFERMHNTLSHRVKT